MPINCDLKLTNELSGLNFSVLQSGDGFEILDFDGKVVAWTLDRTLALRIVLGLELLAQ